MEFGDDIEKFNIFEAMKHPLENHSVFMCEVAEITNLDNIFIELEIGVKLDCDSELFAF